MNKIKLIIGIVIPLVFTLGCTQKDIKLEVKQAGCNNFKIDGADYSILTDPCDSVSTNLLLDVSFNFSGDSACLYLIRNFPILYDKQNKVMSNITYDEVLKQSSFFISGTKVTYTYNVTFASLADAQNFNYMILTFHTENVLEDKSPEAKIRVNTSCTTVSKDMYTVNTDTIVKISPFATTFQIKLWDHAAEDGDRVSVYLNGNWIIDNHSLLNEPGTTFYISTDYLNAGKNDLVVFALNQGTSGPNTVSIAINNGTIKNFDPNLETGEAVQLEF